MNKMMIVVALLAGACSKKGGDSGKCNEIAAGAVDRMMGAMQTNVAIPDDAKAAMKEKGDKLKAVIAKHCVDDKWSAEVLDCYGKAASMPDIRTCRGKLPEEASKALQADEMQAMMAGGGMMPRANPEELQKKLDAVNADLEKAQQELSNATDDAARSAAKEKTVQLQKEVFILRQRLDHAKNGGPMMGGGGMGMGHPGMTPPAPAPAPAGSAAPGSGGGM